VRHFSDAPLKSRPLAIFKNTRLGWKGMPGTYTPAYENSQITDGKSFITLGPELLGRKLGVELQRKEKEERVEKVASILPKFCTQL
jgi:hypothetical protein